MLQVTLATILTGHISMLKGILYILCQIAGGILGSLLLVKLLLLCLVGHTASDLHNPREAAFSEAQHV